jgi:hypothetical protein
MNMSHSSNRDAERREHFEDILYAQLVQQQNRQRDMYQRSKQGRQAVNLTANEWLINEVF